MFTTKKNKGFTLIELLVVIAVIAILAVIVVVAVGNANAKSKLAGVQKGMHEVRSQVEIFYLSNGMRYTNVCNAGAAPDGTASLASYMESIGKVALGTAYTGTSTAVGTTQTSTNGICWATADQWIVSMPYKEASYYCIDSTGKEVVKATPQSAGVFTCS